MFHLVLLVPAREAATFEQLTRQAQFFLQARRYTEAASLALRAIALFPEHPRPYAQVGYALAWQKRAEAPDWILKAIARDPQNKLWRVALSDMYTIRGKWKQAIKPMSEAIAMDPTNPKLYSMMGLILVHCKSPREGLNYLKRSLELDPTNALTFQRASIALAKIRDNKGAEEYLKKALELQPDNPVIKNTLGWRLLNRGRREEAEDVFYETLRIDPGSSPSKLGLGAPAGVKKGPADIILRASLRLWSIPHKMFLTPAAMSAAVTIPLFLLNDGGSWLVRAIFLAIAGLAWCYIFALTFVRVIGKRRGVQFV